MIDWKLMRGLAVRREPLFATTEGKPAEGLMIGKLMDTIAEIERIKRSTPPNPLAGITHLYAADNMMDAAMRLAVVAGTSPMAPQPLVMRSKKVPPGYIVGMRGATAVVVVGPDSHEQSERGENV